MIDPITADQMTGDTLPLSKWSGGFTHWTEGNTAFLSVAFTYKVPEAVDWAREYRLFGYETVAGGPGLFTEKMKAIMRPWASVPGPGSVGHKPGALQRHNPAATIATRGCDQKCSFCIVPKMEGVFSFLRDDDWPVLPVLCDNNLSGLPVDRQERIIQRYEDSGVPLLDANSGFEPRSFDEATFERWSRINQGVWRFAYDDMQEREFVRRVCDILGDVPSRKKRVYVLIGNEPYAESMQRINEVIAWGCEPHVQPLMKLVALKREPHVKHDWTAHKLRQVARWANSFGWRARPFEDHVATMRKSARQAQIPEKYDEQQGLFL